MRALKNLYVRKNILKSLHSIQLCEQLRNDSDSVQGFLNESIEDDPKSKMERGLLYTEYQKYCYKYDRKALTKNRFYSSLRAKGYQDHKSNGEWYFLNVRLKLSFENVPENDSNRYY